MSRSLSMSSRASLLLSSSVLTAKHQRAPSVPTIVQRSKGALLYVLATTVRERAVLYGSAALNLYLPRRHWFPDSDLDFFIVIDSAEQFGKIVEEACTSVNKHLRAVFGDATLTVNWYLVSHGPDDITMTVSVNGHKIADLTRQFSQKVAPLTTAFPRECSTAVIAHDTPSFLFWVISYHEALHRIACTVSCQPCLDGSAVLSRQANASRIAKDNERLVKLAELHALGVVLDKPCGFLLDASACASQLPVLPCRVDASAGVLLPAFVNRRAARLDAQTSVAQAGVPSSLRTAPQTFARQAEALARKVSVLRADLLSLRSFVQSQQASCASAWKPLLADAQRLTARRERKLVSKLDKATERERLLNLRNSTMTKCIEEQKIALRLCRDACKEGHDMILLVMETVGVFKDLLLAIRSETRVVVSKLSSVLKVIADRSPDNFDVQSLAPSFDKLLQLYISKGVSGFVDRTASPTLEISAAVSKSSSPAELDNADPQDVFISLHSQMVRAMLHANDILVGKLDALKTFTHVCKNTDGVQFTIRGTLDEVDNGADFRRAEMLNKHAESALVLMIMPPFERLAYISRVARAAVNDCAENSGLLGLLKKTMPAKLDVSCLDAAMRVATRLLRVYNTLAEQV